MNRNKELVASSLPHILNTTPILIISVVLLALRLHSYLLFHVSVEFFSTLIAGSVFLFVWNSRKMIKNHFFLLLGSSLLFVGAFDFIHTLTFEGMNLFAQYNANIPTQLWLASRYMLVLSFLIAPLFIEKKINLFMMYLSLTATVVLFFLSIFYWKNFPDAYVVGLGLTQFKKVSEYFIVIGFSVATVVLYQLRKHFDQKVLILLLISLITSILSDLIFTLYIGVSDIFNLFGHLFKVFSYYAIYKAILEIGFTQPYSLLFRELQETNKRKDEFMSLAGHELRTPITTIKLSADYLKKKMRNYNDSGGVSAASKIDELTNRVYKMINEMLDLGKVEVKNLEMRKDQLKLHLFLRKVVRDIRKNFSTHKIILKKTEAATVFADKDRISQVISNLIANAVKYSSPGSKVYVRQYNGKNKTIVEVQDFGIGISKENLPYLFEKYYRTYGGRQQARGLGLGLYLSKQIIEIHKGRIWVESEKDKGSIFRFSLALKKS